MTTKGFSDCGDLDVSDRWGIVKQAVRGLQSFFTPSVELLADGNGLLLPVNDLHANFPTVFGTARERTTRSCTLDMAPNENCFQSILLSPVPTDMMVNSAFDGA